MESGFKSLTSDLIQLFFQGLDHGFFLNIQYGSQYFVIHNTVQIGQRCLDTFDVHCDRMIMHQRVFGGRVMLES
ncbi:Uncharacterised protein [Vibrio cholerae]|nr:Uncharacterised protein [Vibrio cholerae]CSI65465.1 Uncharacterised protein [Vibrio cholerae]